LLDKNISVADRRQFTSVRDPQEWRNPFLLLNSNGSITVITDASTEHMVSADNLKDFLLALAPSQWPFGRVVSIRPCATRSEDKEKFEQEDLLLKKSWGILREVMRSLQLEMNMWPSGETTHATVKREEGNNSAKRIEESAGRNEKIGSKDHGDAAKLSPGKQSGTRIDATKIRMPGPAEMLKFMREAINEAKAGLAEGGIPIGSVLVRNGEIIALGHNRRVQNGDPTSHAEIDCLRNAGRIKTFQDTVLYSTLMPCAMCAGASVQFRIPIVVAGEDRTFPSAKELMQQNGIKTIDLNLEECFELMQQFAREHPQIWSEDIGD